VGNARNRKTVSPIRSSKSRALGVLPEDLDEHDLLRVAHIRVAGVGVDIRELVLELGDLRRHVAGGETQSVGVEGLDDALERDLGVGGVVDAEGA
jgi:hypothetical protein